MNEEKPVVVVSGLSGAGKSTALNVFEDMGFFCVDGLPARMAPALIDIFFASASAQYPGLAMGMDMREHDFAGQWSSLFGQDAVLARPVLLFVEASSAVLLRRYATTRRPHPLETKTFGLEEAIACERESLAAVRRQADLVLDTSQYSIHDLRRSLQEKWSAFGVCSLRMRIHLISFGFKYGIPAEADTVTDLRFLPNPFFVENLRLLSGQDQTVALYVLDTGPGKAYLQQLFAYLDCTLPLYAAEGRYRLTMAFGCTGGRHRSVAVTEAVYAYLKQNYAVSVEHRHLALG